MIDAPKNQVIELFSGVGGLSLGAVRAGFQIVLAVDNDKHAIKAHSLNFPNTKHISSDISRITGSELLNQSGIRNESLDGIIGGPPCQGFSSIGKRDILDPRNDLFIKFFELVSQCRPKFFVAENVPGILDKKYDEIRKVAFEFVKDGFLINDPIKLIASDFGAATNRERIFFIGFRKDVKQSFSMQNIEKRKVNNPITVKRALEGLPTHIHKEWVKEKQSWRVIKEMQDSIFRRKISSTIPEGVGDIDTIKFYKEQNLVSGCFGTRHSKKVEERYRKLKPGEMDKISKSTRLEWSGFCPTLRAGTGSDHGSYQAVRPIHPSSPRVITPREAARLQGFPDWFRFAPSKWHSFRQIGNSVSPILAEAIFSVLQSCQNEVTNILELQETLEREYDRTS